VAGKRKKKRTSTGKRKKRAAPKRKQRREEIELGARGKRFVDLGIVGVLLLAAYFAIFGGEYTVFRMGGLEALESERAAELAATEAEIDSLESVALELRSDAEAIERVARERYGMIRDGEILYRFREVAPADSAKIDESKEPE